MDRQRVLPCDVVHAKKVVYPLVRLELRQEVRCYTKVLPADVPVELLGVNGHELLKLLREFLVLHRRLLGGHELGQIALGVRMAGRARLVYTCSPTRPVMEPLHASVCRRRLGIEFASRLRLLRLPHCN